jgi:hypothetical protein
MPFPHAPPQLSTTLDMGPRVAAGTWNVRTIGGKVRTRSALPGRGDPPPQRGVMGLGGIAIPQQQVQLVRGQAQ